MLYGRLSLCKLNLSRDILLCIYLLSIMYLKTYIYIMITFLILFFPLQIIKFIHAVRNIFWILLWCVIPNINFINRYIKLKCIIDICLKNIIKIYSFCKIMCCYCELVIEFSWVEMFYLKNWYVPLLLFQPNIGTIIVGSFIIIND